MSGNLHNAILDRLCNFLLYLIHGDIYGAQLATSRSLTNQKALRDVFLKISSYYSRNFHHYSWHFNLFKGSDISLDWFLIIFKQCSECSFMTNSVLLKQKRPNTFPLSEHRDVWSQRKIYSMKVIWEKLDKYLLLLFRKAIYTIRPLSLIWW